MPLLLVRYAGLLGLLLGLSHTAQAYQATGPGSKTYAVSAQVMFTPGEDAAGLIIETIGRARKQVLVQAFSFTHGDIAQALIAAHHRGVEVKLIADRDQTRHMKRGQVSRIAAAGVPVWLDGDHQSAHNKVMIIDAGTTQATVITGSYNFTKAAQFKNAENVLVLRGNRALAEAYRADWQRHLPHARPFDANQSHNKR